jgi:hypothetical protein
MASPIGGPWKRPRSIPNQMIMGNENSDRVVDNHMERRLHAGIGKDNYAYKTVIAANGLESLARVKGRFFNAGACARGLPEFCPTADHERSWGRNRTSLRDFASACNSYEMCNLKKVWVGLKIRRYLVLWGFNSPSRHQHYPHLFE